MASHSATPEETPVFIDPIIVKAIKSLLPVAYKGIREGCICLNIDSSLPDEYKNDTNRNIISTHFAKVKAFKDCYIKLNGSILSIEDEEYHKSW